MQIPPASILSLAGQAATTSRAPASQSQQSAAAADKSRAADAAALSSASHEDVAELTGDGSQVGDRDADGRQAWQFSGGPGSEEEQAGPKKLAPSEESDGGLSVLV